MKIPFLHRREVALSEEAARDSDLGRNRVFYYMPEPGLVTSWYLARRCEEECYRAERYGRPLALLVIEPALESDGSAVQRQLADWLRREIRKSDVAGCLGRRRYAILLPETDGDGASGLAARLRRAVRHVETGFSSYPQDGGTLGDLTAAAMHRLGQVAEQVA